MDFSYSLVSGATCAPAGVHILQCCTAIYNMYIGRDVYIYIYIYASATRGNGARGKLSYCKTAS